MSTATPTIAPARGNPLRRLLKWLGLALLALLVLLALGLWWLLGSAAGARFALARASAATDGKLTLAASHGRLAGPLTLDGLRWHDAQAGIDVRVRELHLDLAPWALLARRLQLRMVEATGIDVALHSVPAAPPAPPRPLTLEPPLDIVLERLTLREAQLSQDDAAVFAFDRLDAAAGWTRAGASLRSFALRAPAGQVDAHGRVANAQGYPGEGTLDFRWQLGTLDYAGKLELAGDGRRATLALALSAPLSARLDATLVQDAQLPWTFKLDLPRFDPRLLAAGAPLQAAALTLEGSGNASAGSIAGTATLNDHAVRVEPLRYTLAGHRLQLAPLTLKAADGAGAFNARGHVDLDAQPPAGELALDWNGVDIPADLAGQRLASHGQLALRGSAQAYHASGAFALGPPGQLADIELDLDGTPTAITLKQLALRQARGGLDAHGTLTLTPAPGWDLSARARQLDPGAFVAGWPGAIDLALSSQGSVGDHGAVASVKLERLGGTLRGKPLRGVADLRLEAPWQLVGHLDLGAGSSHLAADGRGGMQNDARLRFAIGALGDWLPAASGALDGDFRIRGQWPQLAVEGHARARDIASGDTRLGKLDLDANVRQLDPPQGELTLAASALANSHLQFDSLTLRASGERGHHALGVVAEGQPLGLRLDLDGSVDAANAWHATLHRLDLTLAQLPPLALQRPATLEVGNGAAKLSELCLASDDTHLCAAGSGATDGRLEARWNIAALPLALLARLGGDLPLALDGTLEGHGELRRSAGAALVGTAQLDSSRGSIAASDRPDTALLSYTGLAVAATLTPQGAQASVHAGFDHDGRLDGQVTLDGSFGGTQALGGGIDLTLNDLAFVEAFTDQVAATRGRLGAHYTLAGSSSAPELTGALTLTDLATEVPAAGLKLHDGQLSLRASDAAHFVLEGSLRSGDGTLRLAGSGGTAADAPLSATLNGERFLAADIPAARVVIAPALTIERNHGQLRIGGSVTIPSAALDVAQLPGGAASQASADVVVVDAPAPPAGKPLPVLVDVDVKLGDDVKLAGFGLDGRVSGQLNINQRPGRAPVGTGTINAQGTYRAYGQNLVIESGRVLFAGTALDNPGLDIRAVRRIAGAAGSLDDDLVAGLQVRGTALAPVLTVFSRPVMEQSEALSYLLTGKPLSSLKSGEGDMLGSAARALGSATGDLLAKGIGRRLGVDAGVADNGALGGAAFTVGKYLSPKLYLSYGVGLFSPGEVVSLKYSFSKRWNFEAQNATTGSRAGINYRHER